MSEGEEGDTGTDAGEEGNADTGDSADTSNDTDTGGNEGDTGTEVGDTEFVLPDEHKDKPWAEKVKSQDDLYKQIENLTALAGKKNAYPEDGASTEDLDTFFEGLRPENAESYDFGEDHPNPEFAAKVGDIFFDAGISEHQANKIIPAYNALEQAALEDFTSEEGFNKQMTDSFGEKFDAVVVSVVNEHKKHMSEEDQALMEGIPNQYLGMVYRLTNAMVKSYGAEEAGDSAHSEKSGSTSTTDVGSQRSEIRKDIRDLETKAHTAQQKKDLVDRLQKTYES